MMIKVVRGNPTPEELAAALAVVRARAASAPGSDEGPRPPEGWSDPARVARTRICGARPALVGADVLAVVGSAAPRGRGIGLPGGPGGA